MKIDEVELRVIRVPFRSAFTTSFGSQTEKHTVIVTVRSAGVEGYGEGVMETLPEYREETLEGALRFVKLGGRIVYITCSVLRAENEDRIAAFMSRHDDLLPIDAKAQANSAGLPALAEHRSALGPGFRLSPRATGTDGFYIATLTRT